MPKNICKWRNTNVNKTTWSSFTIYINKYYSLRFSSDISIKHPQKYIFYVNALWITFFTSVICDENGSLENILFQHFQQQKFVASPPPLVEDINSKFQEVE